MSRRRMLWQLYPSYLLITFLSVVAVAGYSIYSFRGGYLDQTAEDLRARAHLIQQQAVALIGAGQYTEVDSLCKNLGRAAQTRITVILPDGAVVGDSEEDAMAMENHGTRPEIAEALTSGSGVSIRRSNTLQLNMMYVAVRATKDSRTVAVVRTSIPLTFIDRAISDTRFNMVLVGLAIAILAALLSLYVSRRISRPLEFLKKGAEAFAAGRLSRRLPVIGSEEVGTLIEAMNEMASQLDQRINTITQQRQEQEAILASMVEGVLALDTDERLITVNDTAASLLNVDREQARGMTLQEAVRNTALQKIIGDTLASRQPVRGEVIFSGEYDRIALASATILRNADGDDIGVLVVLNDVTRVRRLENLRRDFVANVSHELKTPITSIQGAVETLTDGAIDNAADAKRFLEITARQADRLHHIVEDLLSLSRIENQSESGEMVLKNAPLRAILESAIAACEAKTSAADVPIQLECPGELSGMVNAALLEQAVVNLIDNAIKYNVNRHPITVLAETGPDNIRIAVRDQGCGIDQRHLARLFERFFVVDKARSRELGGTGLGLAIVKHIALAHGGQVEVESRPGEGSTFSIKLPRAERSDRSL